MSAAPAPVRTAQARRAFRGPALLSGGFRPFFLGAGLWALLAIAVWPAVLTGRLELPTAFQALDWHAHEMLFGYGAAVVAGFLLTAVPNWTGRLPVVGRPLALLAGLWLAGRLAVLVSGVIGAVPAAALDVLFLLALAGVTAREVIAGRNTRNIKVVGVVLALALANVWFHAEAHVTGTATLAARAALALLVFLILLIGGRVVPSFTGNWLARQSGETRPTPFNRRDGVVLGLSGLALVLWTGWPDALATGLALAVAGVGNLWRLSRWRGWRTLKDPLVLVLHVGFLLAALGFLAEAARIGFPALSLGAAGLHVWAIGAVGTMTLAIMTRATLGHTGRALAASPTTQAAYACMLLALAARLMMAAAPGLLTVFLWGAALSWCVGFALFLAAYGPLLLAPRKG